MSAHRYILPFLLAIVLAGATASGQSNQYSSNGDYAETFWYNGTVNGDVMLSTDNRSSTANLGFDLWYSSTEVVSGYAAIPRNSVTGNSDSELELNLDLSSFQGTIYSCDYNWYQMICTPTTLSGTIRVTWRKVNGGTTVETFTLRSNNPGFVEHERGTREWHAATATGTMVGFSFGPTYASMGKTHNVQINIEKPEK